MLKYEFLLQLGNALSGLPKAEIERSVTFYGEMIEDRMEEGMTEEEAVASLGAVQEVAEQIMGETPSPKIVKERIKPQRSLDTLTIVLLIVGAPIWLSLAIAALAVAFAVFVSLWSVVVSLWASFASFVGTAIGMLFVCGVYVYHGKLLAALGFFGMVLVSVALSILLFFGSLYATKGCVWLVKQSVLLVKRIIWKRGSKT